MPCTGTISGLRHFNLSTATEVGGYFALDVSVTRAENLTLRLMSSGQAIGSPVAVKVVPAAVSAAQSRVHYTFPNPLVAGNKLMVTVKLLDAFNNTVLPSAADNTSLELKGKHQQTVHKGLLVELLLSGLRHPDLDTLMRFE